MTTKQIVRLAINSINASPSGSKNLIVSLTSPGEILVEFVIDKEHVKNLNGGALAITSEGLREIMEQLGQEVTEAHFTVDDYTSKRILKRQQRRKQ